MAGSTISGTVTSTVTLGSASYPSPLTVAGTGVVAPSAYAATGVYGPAGSGTLINDGSITGGVGTNSSLAFSAGGTGGAGISLLDGATATNNGQITGGSGGDGDEFGGVGGAGVSLGAGAALINQAVITGGVGGVAEGGGLPGSDTTNGFGGAGVWLDGGTLDNAATIIGGYGPGGVDSEGSGVVLLAGTLINSGTIAGGTGLGNEVAASARYGNGVYLEAGATLINTGTIIGGNDKFGGGTGIFLAAGATLTIAGAVIGGAGDLSGGAGVDLSNGGSLDNLGTVTGGGGGGGTGIVLANGGTLTNAATIVGGSGISSVYNMQIQGGIGVELTKGAVAVNAGFISGGAAKGNGVGNEGGDGVYLSGGSTLTNNAGATITGGAGGYAGDGANYGGGAGAGVAGGTLTNAGVITGGSGVGLVPSIYGGNGGIGVSLTAGAMVTNTGTIGGGSAGFDIFGEHGGAGVVVAGSHTTVSTLVNFAVITGGAGGAGAPGASYYLSSFATIAGGAGAYVRSDGTLINHGTIAGAAGVYVGAGGSFGSGGDGAISGGDGVTLGSAITTTHLGVVTVTSGGSLLNLGTIISGVGVSVAAGGTLTTGDTVSGGIYGGVTADAVSFSAAGTLVVDPGIKFVGQVVGNASSIDDLDLSAGSATGTLSGIGTQIVDFAQITVVSDAHWTLAGANTIASGVTLTELSGASVTATGTLVNDGSIVLDPSTMMVAALTGSGSVAIEAGSSVTVQGTISGGETLTFGGSGAYLHLDSPDSVAGSITNFGTGETIDLKGIDPSSVSYAAGQLTFSGGDIALGLANGGTAVASTSADGAEVTVVLCFCANTMILTPSGERPVQELAVGDPVTTHRGEQRPIVWIGVGKVLATRGQRSAATPVIVRKGALAENVPNRDLRVTRGHALWFGGVLIPVEYLVNHRLIEWDDRTQEVELYHIELESHDVLVANGAPAESYRDDGNRWLFDNANSGWDLPPQQPCAPVLTGGAVVDAVWRRLLERAGPRPGLPLTDDPDLHLIVDGARVDASDRHGMALIFALPDRARSVRIVSRAAAPAELGVARDPRVLGVAMRRVALRQGTRFRVMDAADAALVDGFHPFEPGSGLRWTNGDAVVPAALFQGFDGPADLVLHVGSTTRYPLIGGVGSHTAVAPEDARANAEPRRVTRRIVARGR